MRLTLNPTLICKNFPQRQRTHWAMGRLLHANLLLEDAVRHDGEMFARPLLLRLMHQVATRVPRRATRPLTPTGASPHSMPPATLYTCRRSPQRSCGQQPGAMRVAWGLRQSLIIAPALRGASLRAVPLSRVPLGTIPGQQSGAVRGKTGRRRKLPAPLTHQSGRGPSANIATNRPENHATHGVRNEDRNLYGGLIFLSSFVHARLYSPTRTNRSVSPYILSTAERPRICKQLISAYHNVGSNNGSCVSDVCQ